MFPYPHSGVLCFIFGKSGESGWSISKINHRPYKHWWIFCTHSRLLQAYLSLLYDFTLCLNFPLAYAVRVFAILIFGEEVKVWQDFNNDDNGQQASFDQKSSIKPLAQTC